MLVVMMRLCVVCRPRRVDEDLEKQKKAERLEKAITYKKHLLANALKIPPAINQFNTTVKDDLKDKLFNLLSKYTPETRKEKIQRLKKENPKEGDKPVLLKFGINHVTDLIERKVAKFVVIAADVDPIEVVMYLPTLCKRMGLPYAIVGSKEELGNLVHLNKTAAVCLNEYRAEDGELWSDVVDTCKAMFYDCYESTMATWGGGVLLSKQNESEVKVDETN